MLGCCCGCDNACVKMPPLDMWGRVEYAVNTQANYNSSPYNSGWFDAGVQFLARVPPTPWQNRDVRDGGGMVTPFWPGNNLVTAVMPRCQYTSIDDNTPTGPIILLYISYAQNFGRAIGPFLSLENKPIYDINGNPTALFDEYQGNAGGSQVRLFMYCWRDAVDSVVVPPNQINAMYTVINQWTNHSGRCFTGSWSLFNDVTGTVVGFAAPVIPRYHHGCPLGGSLDQGNTQASFDNHTPIGWRLDDGPLYEASVTFTVEIGNDEDPSFDGAVFNFTYHDTQGITEPDLDPLWILQVTRYRAGGEGYELALPYGEPSGLIMAPVMHVWINGMPVLFYYFQHSWIVAKGYEANAFWAQGDPWPTNGCYVRSFVMS